MKLITYLIFVIASIGIGTKLAFDTEKKPMEIKQPSFPKSLGRH